MSQSQMLKMNERMIKKVPLINDAQTTYSYSENSLLLCSPVTKLFIFDQTIIKYSAGASMTVK